MPHRAGVCGHDETQSVSQLASDHEMATRNEAEAELTVLGSPGCGPGPGRGSTLRPPQGQAPCAAAVPQLSSGASGGKLPSPLCTYPAPLLDPCPKLHMALSIFGA